MKRISVAIALALCVALPASAQMYKWVDSNGKVQYSDKPPPSNIKTEKLRAPPPAAPAAGDAKGGTPKDAAKAGPKTPAEQEQAFRKRQLEASKAQEADEKKQAQARDKAEHCKRATAAVNALQLGGRQQRIDSKGERVFLDEQQISQELAKARQEAAAACN
ncbi:MAG: DUF4124 domain-containing protein [Betaproteobacteria bacterium]|nr:DUF4124 domain-containing protein [Betaproteobacteria bacterium]